MGKRPSCPHDSPLYDYSPWILRTHRGGAGRRRFALTSLLKGYIVGPDMFGMRKRHKWTSEEQRLLGRLDARQETLEDKWTNHRAELKKLVNRLEKQWERQEAKLRAELDKSQKIDDNGNEPTVDEITTRVRARRARHGLHGT